MAWNRVTGSYGGGVAYKLVSDIGFGEVDKALNRSNLPVQDRIKTWGDILVAAGIAVAEGMGYMDRQSGMVRDAALAAGVVAAANTVEVGESFAKVGPYGKKYSLVKGGALHQTPNYRPQRTAF